MASACAPQVFAVLEPYGQAKAIGLAEETITSSCALPVLDACGEVTAKPRKSKTYTGPKVYAKKENECAKGVCKTIHPDENEDCVTRCVSEPCYNEVYRDDPVEPGEIDRTRQGCLSSENTHKC
eukprot:6368255-Amphidinium_carterae.1